MPLQFERLVWWFVYGNWTYTEEEQALVDLEREVRELLRQKPNEKLFVRLEALCAKKIPVSAYKARKDALDSIKRDANARILPSAPKPKGGNPPKIQSKKEIKIEEDSDSDSDVNDEEMLDALVSRFGKRQPQKNPSTSSSSSYRPSSYTPLSPLQRMSHDWEDEYVDASTQANPKSRVSKNIMNHSVVQTSVLRHLPPPSQSGNGYVQVRTTASLRDDHFRIMLEVDRQGPVRGGVVAAIRGLTHRELREQGKFWVYVRTAKNDWAHYSGEEKW